MSLKRGLALLMVTAFGFGSLLPSAAITISSSNTTSSTLEAYVLPGNSTAGAIITQNINATSSSTLAAKNFSTTTLSTVADVTTNANRSTLATTVAEAGQAIYTTLQPAFAGSNQTQNWNVVVCETSAFGFTNGQDFFFALPSGWDLNLENGSAAVVTPSKIFTTAVSNGITLSASAISDVQEKTTSLRAGIAFHVSDIDDNGTTTSTNRECVSINIQHENVIAPSASSSAAVANLYTYNGTTTLATDGIIPAAGSTTNTDLTFAPSILDSSVTLSLANGNDLISSFVRTGATETTSTESPTQAEAIADGAIVQSDLGSTAPTSVLRYKAQTSVSKIPGLIISEPHAGAWNLLNGPSTVRPSYTLHNGATSYFYTANADTLAGNGNYLVVRCETNGATAQLAGTPVVTPLGSDLDSDESEAAVSAGELVINIASRTGSLVDNNFTASRLLVTGLTLAANTGSTASTSTVSTLECYGHARRRAQAGTAANGDIFEALGSAEGATNGGTSATTKFVELYTSNGEAATEMVYQKWARSRGAAGTAEAQYSNTGTGTYTGNSAFFTTYTGTTIGSAAVANATTAMKTVKTATVYGVEVGSLPTASSASGDADKLVTVTIAQNSLSAGLPVTLTGATTSDGPADVAVGLADSTGSVVLSVRSKADAALTLTAPALDSTSGNGTLSITATAAEITPAFTSTAITSELDGADGFVQRGSNALLVFTVTTANTVGFTFSEVFEDAKVNGQPIVRFGDTDKYAALVKPGAGSFNLTITVGETDLTKSITITDDFEPITTTSFPAHGKITFADQRDAKGRFVFSAKRNKFLDSVRVFEVDADGVVTEGNPAFAAKKTKVVLADASDDTEFVCITSARQTDCFDVEN